MSSDRTTRATFVMNKSSRDLLKGLAGRYGVSQSEIMNAAPFLFLVMAERSLARRKSQMATTKLLAEQAYRSILALPGNLVLGDVEDRIDLAIQLEETSIKNHQVHGPTPADIDDLMARGFLPTSDPLRETIVSALHEAGSKGAALRYEAMLREIEDEDEGGDSFIDEEEEAERAARIEALLGDFDIDEFLGIESDQHHDEPTSRDVLSRSSSQSSQWRIVIGGEDITAKTGGEALSQTLQILVRNDPKRLAQVATVKGSKRPLISNNRSTLYPNRPDLGEYSKEFVSGWFVGTNYSKKDVLRLIRAAVEACGLVWGVDAYVRAQ